MAQNEVYKNMERKIFDQKDLVQDAASKEGSISEMGKFIAKMDTAGALLQLMLSSKTI